MNLPADTEDVGDEFDPWVGKILWHRKWQPTPVFLSGKFHGQRSLVGYSPWGSKELDHDQVTGHIQVCIPKNHSVSFFFSIEVQLIYNVLFISGVQISDLVIHIYLFQIPFIDYYETLNLVPCYTVDFYCLSISYIVGCIC